MKKTRYLPLILVLLFALLLAACGGGAAEPTKAPAPAGEAAAPTEEAMPEEGGADSVEVFSWWTGGGEAAGLEAMIKVFAEKISQY
ncbi:MAG: hypothetical protein M5U34_01345 [Chloroflexi bacterium]|nr:hypothetical protein [Chloroflexota bacterium]